jgi:hypothetical protein
MGIHEDGYVILRNVLTDKQNSLRVVQLKIRK